MMSTVRINDNIKKEVLPILDDLGLSLSEAINIFLHQIKINNGIPFSRCSTNVFKCDIPIIFCFYIILYIYI